MWYLGCCTCASVWRSSRERLVEVDFGSKLSSCLWPFGLCCAVFPIRIYDCVGLCCFSDQNCLAQRCC